MQKDKMNSMGFSLKKNCGRFFAIIRNCYMPQAMLMKKNNQIEI